jgi:dTDP-4-amino-4,6-dideoxygalactose transaminase
VRRICDDSELSKVWPIAGLEEEQALINVARSRKWSRTKDCDWRSGPSGQFEGEFAERIGTKHFIALANGTLAIELALLALDLKRGDEVILPASTFFGSVTPVVHLGLIPVFADIDAETFVVSPRSIRECISEKTRAVLIVHLSGLVSDMAAIREICSRHGCFIIEDCAQAVGSEWQGEHVGTLGELGCFSFQQDKVLSCGEGGGLATNDAVLAGRAFSHHLGWKVAGAPPFGKQAVAINSRISHWQSAVLLCQLKRLDDQLQRREANVRLLQSLMHSRVTEAVLPPKYMTRWGIYNVPFRLNVSSNSERAAFLSRLQQLGVPAHEGHLEPLYRRPLFLDNAIEYRKGECPNAERIGECGGFVISQRFFLGPARWMHELAAVFNEA